MSVSALSSSTTNAVAGILVSTFTVFGFGAQMAGGPDRVMFAPGPGQRHIWIFAFLLGLALCLEAVVMHFSKADTGGWPPLSYLGFYGIALCALGLQAFTHVLWLVLALRAFAYSLIFVLSTLPLLVVSYEMLRDWLMRGSPADLDGKQDE